MSDPDEADPAGVGEGRSEGKTCMGTLRFLELSLLKLFLTLPLESLVVLTWERVGNSRPRAVCVVTGFEPEWEGLCVLGPGGGLSAPRDEEAIRLLFGGGWVSG